MIRFLKNISELFCSKPDISHEISENHALRIIFRRRSCRSFNDTCINKKEIDTIIEAGRFAPSTVNLQTWSFITFTSNDWQAKFNRPIPFKGSSAIIICADTYRLKNTFPDFDQTPFINLSFAIFNAGLAAMNMTIAAESLGIRSIMLSETGKTGLLDIQYLKKKLDLPDGVLPITTLVLGRSNMNTPGTPPRQPRYCVAMEKAYKKNVSENLKNWFDQMFIGFKLTHPLSNFNKQIEFYKKKMIEAEKDIKKEFIPNKISSQV